MTSPGPTAARWVADELTCWPPPGPAETSAGDRDWVGVADLTPAELARLHALSVDRGATPAAAAKWLCTWFAGGVAAAVGQTLAHHGAAVLAPVPRWQLHPGGWPERLGLGLGPGAGGLGVAPGHRWAGEPGVRVLADAAAVRRAAVDDLVAAVAPVVAGCRGLARVGAAALWVEVGDALGLAPVRRPGLPVAEPVVAELAAAVGQDGVPWRARPTLEVVEVDGAAAYRAVKAGCCLAWRSRPTPDGPRPVRCATCPLGAD